nr:MAG TPA: hypothetical protein [Caudoviricetes sp.]
MTKKAPAVTEALIMSYVITFISRRTSKDD